MLDVAHQGVMWEKSSKEEKVSLGHDKQSWILKFLISRQKKFAYHDLLMTSLGHRFEKCWKISIVSGGQVIWEQIRPYMKNFFYLGASQKCP